MTAPSTTAADAIVQSLIAHGVDTVFAIPGVQTYHLFDAFARNAERMRVIGPRHEQTTAYMAFGYAKSTGNVGVYSVVPGPGVLNSTAALCSAYGASTPVLCVTGQVPSAYIGSGKGHLHELPDQLATLRTLTKWAERIEDPAQASRLVAEAFLQMRTGRPRPVALEMPWDVFGMQAPVEPVTPQAVSQVEPDPDAIERAGGLLRNAHNPMIMVGSGAMHACDEVLALAEALQAPVVPFRSGRGVVSEAHPLGFNCAAGFKRWAETDVLVGIGSRLELLWFRWPDKPAGLKIINIDIDPEQVPRLGPDVAITADAKTSTARLLAAVERTGPRRASRLDEMQGVKARTWQEAQKIQPHMEYLAAIRDVLPDDGFFVEEICQAGFTSYYGFPVYRPRTFVSCGHQGTLGFGFPTALGVKVANPYKAVVSITGDGGFMFGVQDLATAVEYGINLVTVLFNNNAYGNVLRDQARLFDGRVLGSRLRNPDFVKLAESFGMAGVRASSPAQLCRELEVALANDAPALIEVPVDAASEVSPWEFLMPAARG
jgi:acetolactate synthase I/II/III large subunit